MAELNIKDTLKESLDTLSKSPITILDAIILTYITTLQMSTTQSETTTILLMIINIIILSNSIKHFYNKTKNSSLEKISSVGLRTYLELAIDYVILSFIVTLGFTIFIIPGLYILIRLNFFAHAMIIDDECMIKAFKRSWKTTSYNWCRLFILTLIIFTPKIAYTLIAGNGITMTSLYETNMISLLLSTITFALMISIETTAYLKLNETKNTKR